MTPRLLAAAAVACVVSAAPAASGDPGARCLEAHEQGQRARKAGHLLEARDALVACAAAACPGLVRADCARWGEEVDAELPTIVIDVAAGRPLDGARVLVDGRATAGLLDGRAVPLDPGRHALRVEGADGATLGATTFVLPTGVKNRLVPVALDDAAPPRPPAARAATAIALGGVAVIALGNFAAFAALGQADYDELKARCAPRCAAAESARVHRELVAADVALVVAGVASAGVAATLLLWPRPDASPPRAALAVAPSPRGLVVGLGASF